MQMPYSSFDEHLGELFPGYFEFYTNYFDFENNFITCHGDGDFGNAMAFQRNFS